MWNIQQIWNESLKLERYNVKERNYISATDFGKPFLDRFLKMKGEKETNPYDERVLRTFAAGDQFHWLIKKVFEKVGILIDAEKYIEIPAEEGRLKVLGYYDAKVGGIENWNEARKRVKDYGFAEAIENRAMKLIDYFENKFPNGLEPLLYEIKSVNSLAFMSHKQGRGYLKEAYPHHQLQLYTYLKATGINEGRILYVSKDDLTLEENVVSLFSESIKERWEKDIQEMSRYYLENIEPPKEEDIVFDEDKKKFVLNWRIERSPYLTRITGLSKEDWLKKVKEECKEKNKELRKSKKESIKVEPMTAEDVVEREMKKEKEKENEVKLDEVQREYNEEIARTAKE